MRFERRGSSRSRGGLVWLALRVACAGALLGALAVPASAVAVSQASRVSRPAALASGGTATAVPGTSGLYGVACAPGTATCYAVGLLNGSAGNFGVLVRVKDGKLAGVQEVPGTSVLYGIACPTASVCYAVGYPTPPPLPAALVDWAVVTITNGTPGTVRTVAPPGGLTPGSDTGIACETATTCVAVGDGNPSPTGPANGKVMGLVVPIADGQPGAMQEVATPVAGSQGLLLDEVACLPETTTCYATGNVDNPNQAPYPNGGVIVPITAGSAGSAQEVTAATGAVTELIGISCPTAKACYVTGTGLTADQAGFGLVGTLAGGTVSDIRATPGAGPYGISCPAGSSSCHAVGQADSGQIGVVDPVNNGKPGTPLQIAGASWLWGVSCGASCVAAGFGSGEGVIWAAPKLEIWATIGSKRSEVDDTTAGKPAKLAVGQRVMLEARFSDGSAVISPDWDGIAAPQAIGYYQWLPLKGKVTALDTGHFKEKEFYFYWIAPGDYHVTLTAKDAKTGKSYQANAYFKVQRPAVKLFAANTCQVSIRHAKTGVHVLAFGGDPNCDGGDGIVWNYSIEAPAAAGGKIGMAQILTDGLRHNRNACTIVTRHKKEIVNSYTADGTIEALDTSFWYDHADEVSAGEISPTEVQRDFPTTPLTNKGTWTEDFRVSDWLMFLPQGPDSVPVALAVMHWSFSGTAQWKHEPFGNTYYWDLVDHGGSENQVLAYKKVTAREPEWSHLFLAGKPTGCDA